ncbi:MAG: inositol monophosphatase [Deltaproteobacteria bacterium]|nr:inositol monophosphatase [Deltaproteobacteria bacterium]
MTDERVWGQRLLEMGFAVQRHLHETVTDSLDGLAVPVGQMGGDTIFEIDRRVEPIIAFVAEQWPEETKPLVLIAEGMGKDGRRVFGSSGERPRYRVIVDPIDGTRNLMYDKRSAWFIAAVAHDRGERTALCDTFASVLVELPTSKQSWCDAFVATSGSAVTAVRTRVGGENSRPLKAQPSSADTLRFGFGHVSNFFPGTKILASELAEHIAEETLGAFLPGQALLFDDQYISSGGQMVELIVGHDRFCCDLRPLLYQILERGPGESVRGLECHPYDVAGMLVAKQAGVVVTDGFGGPLDCPLDVHTGVHWCGFANQALADLVQPVIGDWLESHGIVSRSD